MLNIAVCDDDGFEAVLIATYIKEYQKIHTNLDIQYQIFHSSKELWNELDEGTNFDIYLLDIIMPDIDGLTLGKKLRDSNKKAVLIYLTSSRDYALDAFQVYAMQYLVKPIDLDTFCATIDMAIQSLEVPQASTFTINSLNGSIKVHFSTICYVECQQHILHFHLMDGRTITSRNIRVPFEEAVSELLKDSRFVRIHQSYIVNLNYVTNMINQTMEIEMAEKKNTLPIAKSRYSTVKKEYLEFQK